MVQVVNEVSLAPGLLISMPHLADPNFTRAVVLMIEHNDEGSFGLVVNQSSEVSVETLMSALEIKWHGPADDMVWTGGPVMPESGWVLHGLDATVSHESELQAGLESGIPIRVSNDIALSTSPTKLVEIAETPPAHLRFLLGYSGWGPGQLAEEMTRGSWMHADCTAELVFETPAEDMWSSALRSLGIAPESIVAARGVH